MVSDLKWSPVDDRLASADGSGSVRIWNAAPSTAWRLYPPQAERGGDWSIQGADWSSDGRYLVLAGGDVVGFTEPPSFAIWDVQANKLVMENLGDALNLMGLSADFSPDDQAILYLGLKGFPDFSDFATAYVFDAQSGEIIQTFTPGGENLIRSAAWSPDGSQVATALFNNQMIIWDYQTGQQVTRLIHSNNESMMISYVEWSPDGSKIASASDESTAKVWDTHTWEPLFTLQHESPTFVGIAAWSPDGTRLLTGAGNEEQGAKDNTARVWDGTTGEELLVFSGHTMSVWPGDWSPDGKRISTFGNDGTVRIWDSSTGYELLTISVPVLYGGSAWWSPDGQNLAIVGLETLISVWRVWQTTEELVEYANECCVFRQLTPEEREQFGLPPE
jgi:WD40 repeat protein